MSAPAFARRDGAIAAGSPCNPFAWGLHGALDYAFVAPTTAASLLVQLGRLRGPAQILGAQGSGKSTLLRTLARHQRRQGGVAIELRCDRCADIQGALRGALRGQARGASTLVCLDEADALLPVRRRQLLSVAVEQGVSVLLASHRDLRLPTLMRCRVDATLAAWVAGEVLRSSPQAPPLVAAEEITEALQQRRGNLREALRLMYDWYEARWAERRRRPWG